MAVKSGCENLGAQTYAVVIHEDPEGGFWGEVTALPGCYSQYDSIDELKDNIREAILGGLEVPEGAGARSQTRTSRFWMWLFEDSQRI